MGGWVQEYLSLAQRCLPAPPVYREVSSSTSERQIFFTTGSHMRLFFLLKLQALYVDPSLPTRTNSTPPSQYLSLDFRGMAECEVHLFKLDVTVE